MSGAAGPPLGPRRRPGRPPGPSQARAAARPPGRRSEPALRRRRLCAASASPRVAERTGLTKATVFHYFPNKDALLRAVFEAFGERLERAAENWFDPPPASHAARLERLVGVAGRLLRPRSAERPHPLPRAARGRAASAGRRAGGAGAAGLRPLRPPLRRVHRRRHRRRRVLSRPPAGDDHDHRRHHPVRVHAARSGARSSAAAPPAASSLAARGREMAAVDQPRRGAAAACACAARGAPRKGATMKTIDADGHVIEPADLWERELPPSLRGARLRACAGTPTSRQEEVHVEDRCCCRSASSASGWRAARSTTSARACATASCMPGGFDPQRRLRRHGQRGHRHRRALSVDRPLPRSDRGPGARRGLLPRLQRLARRLLPRRARAPDRHRRHPDAGRARGGARAAARRRRRSACAAPSSVPTRATGRALHDPYFDPFWAAAAEAGMPVGLHPSGAGDLPGALQGLRLDAPIMGHPSIFFIDDFIGFSHLVCGGVLERHPQADRRRARSGRRLARPLVRPLRPLRPRLRAGWRPTCTLQAERVLQAPVLRLVRPRRDHAAAARRRSSARTASSGHRTTRTSTRPSRASCASSRNISPSCRRARRTRCAAPTPRNSTDLQSDELRPRDAEAQRSSCRMLCVSALSLLRAYEERTAAPLLALRLRHRALAPLLHRRARLRDRRRVRLRRRRTRRA